MKDSGVEWIGDIPTAWNTVKAKYVVTISHGSDPKEKGDIPVYGSGAESFKTCGEYKEGPAVLLGRKGATLHIPHFVKGKYWNVDTAFDVKLKAFTKDYDLPYYYYCSVCFDYKKYISQTTLPSMTQNDYGNMKMPWPDIREQQLIVEYIGNRCSAIDRTIKATQDSIEKLKEYKAALITRAVTKGLNPDAEMKDSGVEWIGSIPSTWQVERLRFIGRMQNGISKDSQFFGHGYPFVSYKDVYDNPILPSSGSGLVESTKAEQERYSVKSGDIFFTRTSETASEVGFSSVCKQDIPYAVFAGFLIRVRPFNKKLNTNFSVYYFRASHLRPYFAKEMNITTRASLGQNLLKNMPVVLPPLEEQDKIASYLDTECFSIDNLIIKKQHLIDKFTEYRQSLIYHAVTGKIDCRGSEDND